MNTKVLTGFVVVFCSAFCGGCNISFLTQGEPGSGVSATEEREIGDFDRIQLAGSGKIFVTCGEEPSLTITTDDNLLPLIETKVDGNTLEISNTEPISPTITPTYQITTQDLSKLELAGSGNVEVSTINGGDFEVEVAGPGKVTARGLAEKVDISIVGSGAIEMGKLVSDQVSIDIAGSGRATVNAQDSLSVNIAGSGRIDYFGDPKVSKSIAGSGKVSQIQGQATEEVETVEQDSEPVTEEKDSDDDEDEETDENG